jgi:hypothetical protein
VPSDVQFEYVETGEAHEVEACEEKSVDTTMPPPHKEFQRVTGYLKCIKLDEDVHECSFSNERLDAVQQELSTQSVNEAEIRIDNESLVCQVAVFREQTNDTSSAGRCVRAEPTCITQGRNTVKLEEILDQCKDAAALRQQLINVIEERDALILEAEHNAAITEATRKQRDAFRVELENVRAQKDAQSLQFAIMRARYEEEVSLLKNDVHNIKTQRNCIMDGRDALISRAQSTAEDLEAVTKTRDFLKIELQNMRAEHMEDLNQLEEQLYKVRTQIDRFICEQRALMF